MRTPAGRECQYFYGDYYRGRQREECRLLGSTSPPLPWRPKLCDTCPVPEILLANACTHMLLVPRLERTFPFAKQKVSVNTYCPKSMRRGFDPYIGCGQCHHLPPVFTGEKP